MSRWAELTDRRAIIFSQTLKEREKRKREVEQKLFDVFSKYAGQRVYHDGYRLRQRYTHIDCSLHFERLYVSSLISMYLCTMSRNRFTSALRSTTVLISFFNSTIRVERDFRSSS